MAAEPAHLALKSMRAHKEELSTSRKSGLILDCKVGQMQADLQRKWHVSAATVQQLHFENVFECGQFPT